MTAVCLAFIHKTGKGKAADSLFTKSDFGQYLIRTNNSLGAYGRSGQPACLDCGPSPTWQSET